MPTYEYACTSCGNEWEAEQSIKADALTECPKCKQDTAKRQISRGTGFILKGGGWYSDLYASSGNKATETANAIKSSQSEGSSSSSDSSTKSDTSSTTTTTPAASTTSSASSSSSTSGGSSGGSST